MTSIDDKRLEERAWLIRKCGYYYRDGACGYAARKEDAGRFTEAEAKRAAAVEPWHMKAILARDVPDAPCKHCPSEKEIASLKAERDRLREVATSAAIYLDELEANMLRNNVDMMMLDKSDAPSTIAERLRAELTAQEGKNND